jgi:hypothetical protein
MGIKISKYMSYINLFIGALLIVISLINENIQWYFTLIGVLAVLISSASIYLKKKISTQESELK